MRASASVEKQLQVCGCAYRSSASLFTSCRVLELFKLLMKLHTFSINSSYFPSNLGIEIANRTNFATYISEWNASVLLNEKLL